MLVVLEEAKVYQRPQVLDQSLADTFSVLNQPLVDDCSFINPCLDLDIFCWGTTRGPVRPGISWIRNHSILGVRSGVKKHTTAVDKCVGRGIFF